MGPSELGYKVLVTQARECVHVVLLSRESLIYS